MNNRRLVVIGAGPVGLEAALAAAARGYDVTVLEKDTVGANLRRWGSTRLFSPVRMNVSAEARRILGAACPPEDALLTGPEMVERILEPAIMGTPTMLAKIDSRMVFSVGVVNGSFSPFRSLSGLCASTICSSASAIQYFS